ncbi:hypothetical protein INT47_012038, partial [Mucor saturninus]
MDLKHLGYDLTVSFMTFIISLFFREIRPRGSHRIPTEGPVIFVVAPHANQFVDPLLVMRECKRRVSFLIAEKSMHQKFVGFIARMVHAIPVIRPQDLVRKGKGTIHIDCNDMLHVIGTNTQFTTQLCPSDMILMGEDKAQVVEIISDTELMIKHEFKLLDGGEHEYKCMPHVEQASVYQSVHDALNSGGCITIFPEGGSHDRMEMLPLKAGVTLMALGAMSQYPGLDVKIVPVGLNYFHAHKFRSRAVIEFGPPLTISPRLVEMYEQGGQEKRQACGKLLNTIYDALKSVTLNAESYETLMFIQAARRLYKPAHRKLHISQVVDLNRRFLIGYNMNKDDPRVVELEERVLAYNQLLKYHGIKDHQVPKTHVGGAHTVLLICKRLFLVLLLALWDFPGAILNLPVVIVANIISQKKAAEALKSSKVKIAGRDVLATWKVLVGLGLVPLLYSFYSLIVGLVLYKTTTLSLWRVLQVCVCTWFVIAGISYASLRSGEIGLDIAKSLKPMIMSVLDPSGAEILRQNRNTLSANITDLINEYGPKTFPDFDVDYINRMKVVSTPPSRSSSSSSFNLSGLTTLKTFQPKFIDTLQDHQLFNWTYTRDFFTRSGSNTPSLISRSNSFSADDDVSIEHVYHI